MTFENPFSTRPLRIPTLSSAYPAKEVWEERTSPLGSKDRGSCQLLTTVAPSLRLRYKLRPRVPQPTTWIDFAAAIRIVK
jgi:hypothetical protein